VKRLSRAVYAAQPSANEQRPLKWSHVPITFDAEDHPGRTTGVGILPLVVSPVIHNVTVTKMLVDGGAGLNLISTDLLEKLQIPREQLAPTGSFQGVNVGATQPLGKIALPVTFGTRKNYRTENIMFDVSDMPLPYNGILGRPALAKFMAVAHYAYNTLKMPAEWGVLTIKADIKDAIFCVEQIYKAAAVSEPPGGRARELNPGGLLPLHLPALRAQECRGNYLARGPRREATPRGPGRGPRDDPGRLTPGGDQRGACPAPTKDKG
jgi:hypothetical protein